MAQSALRQWRCEKSGGLVAARYVGNAVAIAGKDDTFWHGHFATGADKVKEPQVMLAQNRILREHALGDVSKMVHAISQDAAMLVYLDSAVNRKAHPNENFARELMELFCLGEGNYSERDVQETSQMLYGLGSAPQSVSLQFFQHDTGCQRVVEPAS